MDITHAPARETGWLRAAVRPLAAAERGIANALLGADIPPTPLAPAGSGWIGRLKAYWADAATWRGMLYLLIRFPSASSRSPSPWRSSAAPAT